jgi:putative hydrolase of the HAD superfamily
MLRWCGLIKWWRILKPARTWVFDLDNTLHDANPHIFPHINRSMTDYLKTHLGLDEAAANALRERYWLRYGATLSGLMRHHGTDPHHFLWHTHQFPALPSMIMAEQSLRHALKRLPGRKVVFSNAPRHYTRAVLEALGVRDLFDQVFTIEHAGFRPKPDPHGFYRIFRQMRLAPARCIMVEDSLANLRTAKRLGMRTVWVSRAAKSPAYVDVCVSSVLQLPKAAHHLF